MYVAKIYLNSVPGGVVNFILGGWHYDEPPPPSGAQNGYHGNTGCLAKGPRNLHFMIECIKNTKAYKLQNRHISSRCGPGHDPIFVKVGQRSRSYGYIMYSGKMCYNSITGGHTNFVLRANMRTTPTSATRNVCYGNAGCLETELRPVRPRIVVLQTSKIGVHAHQKAPVTWPYYVTWYTHWQSLMK